jgi:hypothetical protein
VFAPAFHRRQGQMYSRRRHFRYYNRHVRTLAWGSDRGSWNLALRNDSVGVADVELNPDIFV